MWLCNGLVRNKGKPPFWGGIAKRKGDKIADGTVVTRQFFTVRNDESYRKSKVEHTVNLYACPDDKAPTYNDGSGFIIQESC